MKPIEECLDEILIELKKSYDTDGRPAIDFDRLQLFFDTKLQRHELFKGLMEILIEEKNAKWLNPPRVYESGSVEPILDHYRYDIIITPRGLYLIETGGYKKIISDLASENTRLANLESHQTRHRKQMTRLTLILAVGAGVAAVLAAIQIYQFFYSYVHAPSY